MEDDAYNSVYYYFITNATTDLTLDNLSADPDYHNNDNSGAAVSNGILPVNSSYNFNLNNGSGSLADILYPGNDSDLEKLLTSLMGARRKNLTSVVALTFVYGLLFLTGVVGNVCTCVVIARNSYMHTVTNYYLFSLAVSDVLTLIFGKWCVCVCLCVCVCVCV